MPSVESNYGPVRCGGCGSIFDLSDFEPNPPPCPHCGQINYQRLVIQPVCDFCSHPFEQEDECWTYPCGAFEYPYHVLGAASEGSADDWAACDECHALIEANDLKGLATRSVDCDIVRHPEAAGERHALFAMTIALHKRFMENRTGPPFRERVADHKKGG